MQFNPELSFGWLENISVLRIKDVCKSFNAKVLFKRKKICLMKEKMNLVLKIHMCNGNSGGQFFVSQDASLRSTILFWPSAGNHHCVRLVPPLPGNTDLFFRERTSSLFQSYIIYALISL
ncbi:nucleobindin-1 [Platysternon megacephalum]|uniref:Nucleobindin-1 n=1 Tax=Platysternon megacephalum TaxID=55544 RepID=A0A4D9DL13_9SAUR|nr:nucleobindin-1 [Platysternon megacephalum]